MTAIKKYLKERHISIQTLSSGAGVSYSTLNDLINGKTDIEKMCFGHVRSIASCLSISTEELWKLCESGLPDLEDGKLFIKNKKYYLQFQSDGHICEQPLHAVNDQIRPFIKDLAQWTMKDIREKEMLKSWQPHIT